MEYYAHISKDGKHKQLLRDHLRNVAELARGFAEAARPGDRNFSQTAELAGLLHDLGKYREEFQVQRLQRGEKSAETEHSIFGAAVAANHFDCLATAFAIAGHHAGLHDEGQLAERIGGSKLRCEEQVPGLIARAEAVDELGPLQTIEPLTFDEGRKEDVRRYEFLTRMLFSMVVDADRLDSERFEQEHRLGRPWKRHTIGLQPDALLDALQEARRRKAAEGGADELTRLRNAVFEDCIRCGSLAQGFFTLTVPTGGAKTLASMAFALEHARHHRSLRRVLVVIPYLSIIEQNARQYRSIFGARHVVEHHSAVETPDVARNTVQREVFEPSQTSETEQAIENWDAPIIVTTSVQFIETLLASSPRRARRLHNIANSVIILDEVQTLPVHLLEPTLDVLRDLRDRYGASFVFCSATQPAFRKSPNLMNGFRPGEFTEIATSPKELYARLRRVDYRIESAQHPWDWTRLADEMPQHRQALCVVNTRQHAFAAWEAVGKRLAERIDDTRDTVFHLSSAMCPAHRLDVLGLSTNPPANNVKARLSAGKPCWVISTQLIEAGVDIDFPVVYRAAGPLDAIVQSGGRCNRESLLKDKNGRPARGKVIVFHPTDGGLPTGIYQKATGITPTYLADPDILATNPDIFGDYFTELYQLAPTDHSKRGEHTIQEDRVAFNFRRVGENARVISEPTVSIVVPYGAAKEVIAAIRKTGRYDRAILRRLQRFMVNVRFGQGRDYERLLAAGALDPLLPGALDIPVLGTWCYDRHRGVVVQGRPPEDFVQ